MTASIRGSAGLVVNPITDEHDSGPAEADHIDGRRLRGERTRARVLDALLALVEEGSLHPTAQAVASRAGVALRTVYHHFEDVEALRIMALDVQLERHRATLIPLDSALPIEERISQVVRLCRDLFEAITPIRRATLIDVNESYEDTEGLRPIQHVRRSFVEETFSPEIARASADRGEFLDALDVTTSWLSWYYLRQSIGLPVPAAESIVALQLRALLDPIAAFA
jgi:TetR/AcrR family transcriptional regulator of autoinduction and epiphytic fitness